MGGMTPEERAVMLYNYVAEDEQLREQGDRGMDLRALFARQIRAAVAEAYEDAARIAGEYPYGTDPRHIAAAIRARAKED